MSVIVFLNGKRVMVAGDKPISLTKQANDITKPSSRQSSFSPTIVLSKTAENMAVMEGLSVLGNTTRLPYQKNRIDVYDIDGTPLIYNGIGVIEQTNDSYQVKAFEGVIDLYKAIENKSLNTIGVPALDHVNSIDTIIDTFTDDTLAYKYILADYNGKTYVNGKWNIDYLVPSARWSYIFDRIHQYAGITYSGTIFTNERFVNKFMTYPKAINQNAPDVTSIANQAAGITSQTTQLNNGGVAQVYVTTQYANIFPSGFNTADATKGTSPAITIHTQGVYQITASGFCQNANTGTTDVIVRRADATGTLLETRTIDAGLNGSVLLSCNVGDIITVGVNLTGQLSVGINNPLTVNLTTTFGRVNGFYVDFSTVFSDFMATEFYNEVLQEFGLTPIKDRFNNHITYYTLDEILQDPNPIDWSDKFSRKKSESYRIGSYAKQNWFKYRHDDDNDLTNDGYFDVDDYNLPDQTVIFQSKMYTHNKGYSPVLPSFRLYPIWEKDVKDDGTINYRELSGRYYALRADPVYSGIPYEFISEYLSTSGSSNAAAIESQYRLSMNDILIDNYAPLKSILNKANMQQVEFFLKPSEVANIGLHRLYYAKQIGYFIINKISNFVRNKPCTLEVVYVDYFTEYVVPNPTIIFDYSSFTQSACMATVNFNTNIPQPADIIVIPYLYQFDIFAGYQWVPIVGVNYPTVSMIGDTIVFDLSFFNPNGAQVKFLFRWVSPQIQIFETMSDPITLSGSCYTSPGPSSLTITSASYLGYTEVPNFYQYPINGSRSKFIRQFTLAYSGVSLPSSYTLRVEYYVYNNFNPSAPYYSLLYTYDVAKTSTDPLTFDWTIEDHLMLASTFRKVRIIINNVISNEFIFSMSTP